jgi:hypothetical protein
VKAGVIVALAASGLVMMSVYGEMRSSVSTIVNKLEIDFRVLTPAIPAAGKLAVSVVIRNKASGTLRVNALFLDMPKILLKVRNSDGSPVNPGPPGMPPLDDGVTGRKVLKPGEFLTYRYTGSEYFGTDLLPGKYQVRFQYANTLPESGDWTGTIETEWLDFEVTKPSVRIRKQE